MKGLDHKGFTVAGSMTVNSLVYDGTPFLRSGNVANIFHPDGMPLTWPYVVHELHIGHFPFFSADTPFKIIFYVLLLWLASLPDRLERRKAGDMLPKHRGCTHSCLFLLTLLVGGLIVSTFGWIYLLQHHFTVSPEIAKLMTTALVAVFLTIAMHILADSLTTKGVRVFWPDETYVGILPKDMRFNNDSAGPSVVLWSMYFLAGTLFALGVVGF